MSKEALFKLVHDGIQFVTASGFESGRDDMGRYLGEQPGLETDDEIVEPPSHMDEFSTEDCLWNQVESSTYVGKPANGYEPDYSGGYVSRYDRLSEDEVALAEYLWLDPWNTTREELTRAWCERQYSEYYPTETVTDDSITIEEAVIYSFCTDNWEFFHQELIDNGEHIPMPAQGGFLSDTRWKEHSWWSLRKTERYLQSAGKHGRDNTTVWQKEQEVNRKIRKTKRTVAGQQQIAAENDWMSANYWAADMADFDGDMHFYTDTPSGRLGEAYRRLLAVNHIDRELKDEWFYTYGYGDESNYRSYLDEEDMPWEIEIKMRPDYDWAGNYTLDCNRKSALNHGWWYLDLHEIDRHSFLEDERQEDRLHEMDNDSDRHHTPDYYDGGWDDYVGPSLSLHDDEDWDEAEERKKDDDKRFKEMADAESDGWTEIDEAREAEERDAMADTTTITQHGGPRGWKASKVARLRQTEPV